jgi:tRNA threonylcarbamoyladenosine biosynthesis protein TsaB
MNIVAFDTSSSACSVALFANNEISSLHKIAPMQQAQLILPMIDSLLASNKVKLNQLDAIAFGCGPGSFTGIRVATSIAQGMGYALNIPLIPVSSLAALAQTAYNDLSWKHILAAVDARIQEIYWGFYQVNSQGLVELQGKEGMGTPENLSQILQNQGLENWQGVGNAWEIYAKQLAIQPVAINSSYLPTADAIIQLARPRVERQEWCAPHQVLPVYLRDEVATKEKKR